MKTPYSLFWNRLFPTVTTPVTNIDGSDCPEKLALLIEQMKQLGNAVIMKSMGSSKLVLMEEGSTINLYDEAIWLRHIAPIFFWIHLPLPMFKWRIVFWGRIIWN